MIFPLPKNHADVAQSVEHILGKDEVTSSNLVISSTAKPLNRNGLGAFLFAEVFHIRGFCSYRDSYAVLISLSKHYIRFAMVFMPSCLLALSLCTYRCMVNATLVCPRISDSVRRSAP